MEVSSSVFGLNPIQLSIQAVTRFFEVAMATSNPDAVAMCYTEDAEFMAPGAPAVKGRDNIRNAIAGFINQGFTQYKVTSTIVYATDGIIGVQGQYQLGQANGQNTDIGKTIQLWRQENGDWKIFRDCFNSDLTA